MLRDIEKTTTQYLNKIFEILEQQYQDTVFWIRDETMTRQLYVSQNFSTVWGYDIHTPYETPMIWFTSLEKSKLDYYINTAQKRHDANYQDDNANKLLYQIVNQTNSLIHLKDKCHVCRSPLGKNYIVGFSKKTDSDSWYIDYKNQLCSWNENDEKIMKQFLIILHDNFGLALTTIQQDKNNWLKCLKDDFNDYFNEQLTLRELECLYYICLGRSAKQIASILNISSRTVEKHIQNIYIKTNYSNKHLLLATFSHYFRQIAAMSPWN